MSIRGTRWDDRATGQPLVVLATDDVVAWPTTTEAWGAPHLALLVVTLTSIDVGELPLRWIAQGLAVFAAWGPGCQQLADRVEDDVIGDDARPGRDDDEVQVAAFPGDSLDAALDAFLRTAPAASFAGGCTPRVVLVIGGAAVALERALERRGAERSAAS